MRLRLIEGPGRQLADHRLLSIEYLVLLEHKCRVEGCHALSHFCELHVQHCGLLVVALLDQIVCTLHINGVLAHGDDVLEESIGDIARLEGAQARVMHHSDVVGRKGMAH